MAKYLIIARGTGIPSTLSPQEVQKVIQKYMSWNANLRKDGRMLHSEKLRAGEGRVLRGQGGKMVVTDGPYAESKEVVGGFAVFELDSLDEAVNWTRRFMELHTQHWPAWEGTTEVRQMFVAQECTEHQREPVQASVNG